MHKIKFGLPLVIITFAISSCKSKILLPDFKIGMTENEWKNEKHDSSKVDAENNYSWNIGDSSIKVTLFLNPDGIPHGNLRVISAYLSSSEGIDTAAKFQQIRDGVDTDSGDEWSDGICSTDKFQRVLKFLKKNFGGPDSVIYKTKGKGKSGSDAISDPIESYAVMKEESANPDLKHRKDSLSRLAGVDTLLSTYYFHNATSKILLIGDAVKVASKIIPFAHHNTAEMHEISNNYEKELSSIIESRKKTLTANDVVTVPIYTEAKSDFDEYGTPERRLYLTAVVDDPYKQRTALEETRTIRGIKGSIVIKDAYGDSLMTYPDFKIDLVEPMPLAKRPGLNYIFHNNGEHELMVYNETRKGKFLRIDHRDMPEQLRKAYESGEKLNVKFVPEAIQFTDGTVLK